MNYRLIRKMTSTRGTFTRTIVAVLAATLILLELFVPHVLRNALSNSARPLWRVEGAISGVISSIPTFFRSRLSLANEISALREELGHAEVAIADRNTLYEESILLKGTFWRPISNENGILAAILALPPHSPYDTLVLDAGSTEGVKEGALVRIGSVVLGTIARVDRHTSVAELFSTTGNTTALYLLHNNISIPVDAVGQGGSSFIITLPKEIPAAQGDKIFFPGIRASLVGVVDSVDMTLSSSFQTIYVRSPVSLFTLRFVEVERARDTP
jgi:cell shape-determining protein MreC